MRTRRGVRAVLLVTALASAAWLAGPAQAAPAPHRSRLAGSPAGVVVLVRQWTWDQAAAAAVGRGGAVSAGLISTLPADASLADRVLSLAAGRPVDASALEGAVGASGSDGGEAAADRMRRANPDATFGQLPPTRVLAGPGMAAAGLLGIGGAGAPPTADPLPETGPLVSVSGELLVIAVPDAAAADRVLDRVQAPRGARAACWSSGWNRRRGGRAWPRCWRSAIRWGRQGWRPPIRPAAPAWWRSRTCARPSRDRRRAPRAPRSTRSRELTRWPSSAISTARWAPWSAPGRWRWSCTRCSAPSRWPPAWWRC